MVFVLGAKLFSRNGIEYVSHFVRVLLMVWVSLLLLRKVVLRMIRPLDSTPCSVQALTCPATKKIEREFHPSMIVDYEMHDNELN